MWKVTIVDKNGFVEGFQKEYLSRGFGSMNKAELESLFFFLLKEYGSIKGKKNFQISNELQIPESKVRRLAYEAELRFGGDHDLKEKELLGILINTYVESRDNNKIQFAIEDKYTQSLLSAKLKDLKHYADTSFNPEIVTVSKSAFSDFLASYDPEASKLFDEEYNKVEAGGDEKDVINRTASRISHLIDKGASVSTLISFFKDKRVDILVESIQQFIQNL